MTSSPRTKTLSAPLRITADRVEEDDLDVEEDEEHRDQVEADAEAQAVRGLDRDAGLVRLGLA